ncbi:MAG: beta galactosidase jelly roll domain-containing protein [Acidobacteriia bacterium]|nr:beta galactosidase jelly roll domain-containing protein [Terriglobia bacterium]
MPNPSPGPRGSPPWLVLNTLTLITVALLFRPQISCNAAQAVNPKAEAGGTAEISLNGSDWKLGSFPFEAGEERQAFSPGFDDRAFRTVSVPGEVQLQLGLKGMQLYDQSKALGEVNQKAWWYRKRFRVPRSDSGKFMRLSFEGVDYFATVWLNGERLGEHEGAYDTFSFDVTSKLHYGADNLLAVEVTCPWIPRDRSFAEYLKGDWMMPDPVETVRLSVPPYLLGPYWGGTPAYGNAAFPMGIWRDVELLASGWTTIDELFVYTEALRPDGKAKLEIEGTVTNHADRETSVTLHLNIVPDNFQGVPAKLPDVSLTLKPGENAFQTEYTIENPQLWWTWDMGKPNLYKLEATLTETADSAAESRQVVFGIRTIERKSDMSYWLNGRRMFLKGAWYPMSDYYASIPTRQSYERDLELYRAANMNHLVNFTVVEKPDFYDLCDRMGILIFFEFPFSQFGPIDALSPSYPRYQTFVKTALSQIRRIILEHRIHPSIVEWAAFAEAHEKTRDVWGLGNVTFSQEGYNTISEGIGKLVASLAPGTIYHPSLCDMGEQHFWMANAGMGTTGDYTEQFNANTGFVSEYGSAAFPSFETLQKMLTPEQMWSPKNRQLPQWFNLPIDVPAYAYQTTFEYNGLFSILHRVNQFVDRHIQSPQQLVEDSQLYQAFIFKYATEAYRRKKHHNVNGVRVWAYA